MPVLLLPPAEQIAEAAEDRAFALAFTACFRGMLNDPVGQTGER
jgi:hypothetical protein